MIRSYRLSSILGIGIRWADVDYQALRTMETTLSRRQSCTVDFYRIIIAPRGDGSAVMSCWVTRTADQASYRHDLHKQEVLPSVDEFLQRVGLGSFNAP